MEFRHMILICKRIIPLKDDDWRYTYGHMKQVQKTPNVGFNSDIWRVATRFETEIYYNNIWNITKAFKTLKL